MTNSNTSVTPPGLISDRIKSLQATKKRITRELEDVDASIKEWKKLLMDSMTASGLEKLSTESSAAYVATMIIPQVQDWDEFYRYIRENDAFHLLDRRPSVSGCNELFESVGVIPGVVPHVFKRINVR